MITEEELAEIVFKGLGGKKISRFFMLNEKPHAGKLKDLIFSWPDPCVFGLIVDAAEKLHWGWEYSDGWFWFKSYGPDCKTTKHVWENNNPMWAVCLGFKEVLEFK